MFVFASLSKHECVFEARRRHVMSIQIMAVIILYGVVSDIPVNEADPDAEHNATIKKFGFFVLQL